MMLMRRLAILGLCPVLFAACGGSSGDGGSAPPPDTLYVRARGDDANSGESPAAALRTVARAIQKLDQLGAGPGVTIYVGPGRYTGGIDIDLVDATASEPLRLIGDPSGKRTGDPPGEVRIDAEGRNNALRIDTAFVVVQGFVLTGAEDSGVRIGAPDVLVFNNLIVDNNLGVAVRGRGARARLINNTIADNRATGVVVAPSGTNAPTDVTLRNNIIQDSRNNISIEVSAERPSALEGYSGDFNLVFAPEFEDQTRTYRPVSIRGENDINEDARFADAPRRDYHLVEGSPAIDGGTSALGDLLVELFQSTTTRTGELDAPPVDIGYHYPVPVEEE